MPLRSWFEGVAGKPGLSTLVLLLAVLVPRLGWFAWLGGELPLPVQDQGLYVRAASAVAAGRGLSFSRDMAAAKSGRAEGGPLAEGWVGNPDYAFGLAPVDSPSAVMEPGYPVLLGVSFVLFGRTVGAVWFVNLAFSIIGAFAVKRLLGRSGEGASLAGALMWAIYPPFVFYTAFAMTETAHAALLALCCALLFRPVTTTRGAFLAGVGLGAFFLFRATGFLLLPLASIYIGIRRWRLQLLLVLGFALAVSPWVVRNQLVLGEPVFMPTKGSLNLWMRNHPEVLLEEGITVPPSIPVNRRELLVYPSYEEFPGELERSRELGRSAREFMAANPRLILWLSLQRAAHFLSPGGSTLGRPAFWAGLAFLLPILILGSMGIAREFRQPETKFLAGVFILYFLMHTMTHGGTRYRLPADMVFIAGTAIFLFRRRKPT
ncbi:MAG: glycosyltransferase family 39 protein [Candidatus Fermentibacteraceae bacterium]